MKLFGFDNTFETIFFIGFVAGSVVRKIYTAGSRGEKAIKRYKSILDIVLISAAGAGLAVPMLYLFSPWLDFANCDMPAWTGWVGTIAFAAAILLLWRSHADLGRNWSATLKIRSEHTLVTNGVYRHIRHPMYAAHLLWAIAQGLLLSNWLAGWVLLVTFVPLYLVRAPKEEQMMLEHFGEEYREYMSRTGRLVPRF